MAWITFPKSFRSAFRIFLPGPAALTRYRGELLLTIVGVFLSVVASTLIYLLLEQGAAIAGLYGLGTLIGLLALALLFNQKRLIDDRFSMINEMLIDQFGTALHRDLFISRRNHYRWEKEELAIHLVNDVLPEIISMAREEANKKQQRQPTETRIIIDSGTTLTPVFRELLNQGLSLKNCPEPIFFTNSLSGIEEIHKVRQQEINVDTERLILIGGQPLLDYRACTGDMTQEILETKWKKTPGATTASLDTSILTIAVLTANWLLSESDDELGINRIGLCARGPGHLRFKKKVHEIADYSVVVAPLGKLLRCSLKTLRELVPSQAKKYEVYWLDDNEPERTFLFTTRRDEHQVLHPITIALEEGSKKSTANYKLMSGTFLFKPPGLTPQDRFESDTPHLYVRNNLVKALGINQPTFRVS